MPRSEESIFSEALDKKTPSEREAFLQAACGDDADLRARVERLLKSHTGAGSFLSKPMVSTMDMPPTEQPGAIIGPYKLREQIGEGGFGIVFVAEQETPVRRKVALKIIKPGMDTKDVIARFEAERQALALMEHPNVARVLDAGATENGRPYFVMELVHGVPITEFCDKNKLPTRGRLLLFADVCRAVQHAHQKGIIHRDLKPSNVMVTLHDGKPVAKVIDFGVSKALSQQLTEKSIYTAYGQMIGTPSYMSPEQAEMSGLGIDTRSDIYSLGVLLYELLTGEAPLDAKRLRSSAYDEMLRLIREEEPPRPSLKISTLGEAATIIAQHRHTDPKQLRLDLSGELDWIVMKCLEKDRGRRYETANGLARDIERYLSDEPVEACPPSNWYRLRKLSRKHRTLINTSAAFAALLVSGAAISGWQAVRATLAEREAQAARARAESFLANERTAREEAVAAKNMADQVSQRLSAATQVVNEGSDYYARGNWASAHERFTKAAEIEPGLDAIYVQRGALYTCLGLWDRAAEDYDSRFRLARRANSQTCFQYALLKFYVGDEAGYRNACQELIRQHGRSSNNGDQWNVTEACLLAPEPVGEPIDLVRRAENLVSSSYVPWHLAIAGRAQLRAGNFEKAAGRFREAIESGAKSPGGVHRVNYVTLAMALHRLGKNAEAELALANGTQAIDEWTKTMIEGTVNTMPISWWDWLECLLYYREAKSLITGSPPAVDPRLTTIQERALGTITYGDAYTFMESGREHVKHEAWDQAASSFGQVLEHLSYGFRPSSQEMKMCLEMIEHPSVFSKLTKLRPGDSRPWLARGRLYASAREWDKAAADYAQAMDRIPARSGRAIVSLELGAVRLLAGDESGYRALCTAIRQEPYDVSDPFIAHALSRLYTLIPSGESESAEAVRMAEGVVAQGSRVAWYLYSLALAHYRAGGDAEAVRWSEQSLAVHPAWMGRGQNYVVLAMACRRLGRESEAQEWLKKTKDWLDETNQVIAKNRFGYAASYYLNDWLSVLVLVREADMLLGANKNDPVPPTELRGPEGSAVPIETKPLSADCAAR